jgi:UPF0755 protein
MSSRRKRNRVDEASAESKGSLFWILRLFVALFAILLCLVSGILVFTIWQGGRLDNIPNPGVESGRLSIIQRLYLGNYLSSREDELAQPIANTSDPVDFVIESGQTADQIASELAAAGLLNNKVLFSNYLRYFGLDSQLEAGNYRIDPRWSIPQLAATLLKAEIIDVQLRFLEGWRAEEMVGYIANVQPAKVDSGTFQAIIERRIIIDLSEYEFLNSLPQSDSLEGFLFPDTYILPVEADAEMLVRMMLENFNEKVTPEMRQEFGSQGLSVQEAVILASIIQREAVVEEERPLMAGVFLNRLNQGMLLQADPTVQYAAGYQARNGSWWKVPLTMSDLQSPSPYNTYVHSGLPPGPISNPGIGALAAVANPITTDFLFFVVDCTADVPGSHVFSRTFEEHLVNVERCR